MTATSNLTEWTEELESSELHVSAACREAITAAFGGATLGQLEIKRLWERGSRTYFRVNQWVGVERCDAYILRSAFIAVENADTTEPTVIDETIRRAA